jgi:hypothetical protein
MSSHACVEVNPSCNYFYASKTKILEGRTNLSECVFEALFKGVSTRFGLQDVEKCFENAFGKVGSAFQNLRLVSIILQKNVAWIAKTRPRNFRFKDAHTDTKRRFKA